MRSVVSYVYSAMPPDHMSRYSLRSYWVSVLYMYEGDIQLVLMEIFSKGMKRRMPEDSDLNKPVNVLVVNYILNNIEHEWVMPDTDPCRKS